jgi:hypothetical protein
MNTFIDQQLTQIKVRELLQEAADARADRKAHMASSTPVARTLKLALAATVPLVLWIVWAFLAG